MRQARGQARVARSSLMPNLNGGLREIRAAGPNLAALGLRFHIPVPGVYDSDHRGAIQLL